MDILSDKIVGDRPKEDILSDKIVGDRPKEDIILAYVGSFDPFHNGHMEAIEKSIEFYSKSTQYTIKNVVILPNNPRKGKPDRSPLMYRTQMLSHLFPLTNNQNWLDKETKNVTIVDTSPVDKVLEKIRHSKYKLIGIIGSDVRVVKWQADEWIVIERQGYPVNEKFSTKESRTSLDSPVEGLRPFTNVITLDKTKYQYISSSMIRAKYANKESLEGLMSPKLVGKYKRCNNVSLSSTLVNINKKLGYVDKTFPTRDKYTDYLNNINLWSEFLKNTELRCILQWKISEGNLPHEFRLVFPDILISNEDKLLIRESYIESCGTLWDIITRGDNLRSRSVGTNFFREIEDPVDEDECLKIMQAFFKWLYDLHQRCYTLSYFVKDQRSSTGRSSAGDDLLVIHGDLSPNNILVFNSDKGPLEFTLIDFDKVKEGDKDDIVREYTQFWSSLDFYSVRDGFNIDPGVFIQMKKLAMENYEVPMYNLVKLHTREDWNVQKEKWEKYWNSKVTEL